MPTLTGTTDSGERVVATLRSSADLSFRSETSTTAATNGSWSLTLAANSTYGFYDVSVGRSGAPNMHYIVVMPAGNGSYTISQVAAAVPSPPASTAPPTRSELDARLTDVEDYVDTIPDLLAGVSGQVFDINAGYGLVSASGDPLNFTGAANITSTQAWFVRQWVPAGKSLTNLWVGIKTGGVYDGSSTPNKLGLYTDAGSLVGATADDPTLWTSAGWRGGAIVGGAIAAQSTGRMIYVGFLVRGANTPPTVSFCAAPGDSAAIYTGPATTARRCFYINSATDLPASINPASTGTATGYVPLLGTS